jgi:hypothetical protein
MPTPVRATGSLNVWQTPGMTLSATMRYEAPTLQRPPVLEEADVIPHGPGEGTPVWLARPVREHHVGHARVSTTRGSLRRRLLEVAPWLGRTDVGPQAVDAGVCDRCLREPRLLPTCGPTVGLAVCRACAAELGYDGWCVGHQDEGAAALPDRWADLVTLWWVATGEVRAEAVTGRAEGSEAALERLLQEP